MSNGWEHRPLKKSDLKIGGNLNTTSLKIPLTTKAVSGDKVIFVLYILKLKNQYS